MGPHICASSQVEEAVCRGTRQSHRETLWRYRLQTAMRIATAHGEPERNTCSAEWAESESSETDNQQSPQSRMRRWVAVSSPHKRTMSFEGTVLSKATGRLHTQLSALCESMETKGVSNPHVAQPQPLIPLRIGPPAAFTTTRPRRVDAAARLMPPLCHSPPWARASPPPACRRRRDS
jgi:hypothetical protein